MGPLVPEIIGNELNFVVALLIGISFGFILEQAGFSTSKKLVGLFYGYDFTVLRVFFTAGVTAMIGVIILGHYGLLDLSLVYINPTFLWSAIIGGLIMGLGFVIGGFCPGTSVCAAAIGKIDAMIFVGGSFIGVFIFAEGYPLFENIYKAEAWGNVRIFDTLGMSQSLFAFLLTFVAVSAFWAVTLIENIVNGKPNPEFNNRKLYIGLTSIAIIIGLTAFALPDRKVALLNEAVNLTTDETKEFETISIDELAFRIMDYDERIQIFDLRTAKEFDALSLPNSINIKLENIFEKDTEKLLANRDKINIFIANDENVAAKGGYISKELGYKNVFYLQGGMNSFINGILQYEKNSPLLSSLSVDTKRFRTTAGEAIAKFIKENKLKQAGSVKKKAKRVLGGC